MSSNTHETFLNPLYILCIAGKDSLGRKPFCETFQVAAFFKFLVLPNRDVPRMILASSQTRLVRCLDLLLDSTSLSRHGQSHLEVARFTGCGDTNAGKTV